jgi:hypothetical protein
LLVVVVSVHVPLQHVPLETLAVLHEPVLVPVWLHIGCPVVHDTCPARHGFIPGLHGPVVHETHVPP